MCSASRKTTDGFTLLEVLLAISILAVVSSVTYVTFATVTKAWQRGTALSDDLHHADFVMEQLVMGLRSAYFPEGKQGESTYGFWLEDNGDNEQSSDVMSWVKQGTALVGADCPFAGSPHRVRFFVERGEDGEYGASITAWRVHGQPEDFDPDELSPVVLAKRITGLNCRAAYRKVDDEIEWLDEWEETNRLPTVVELTLYMEPLEERGPPVEIKRVLGVPVAPLSWK